MCHIQLPVMPPGSESLSSPGHKALPTVELSGQAVGVISRHHTCIIKAYMVNGCLSQNIIHCRKTKNQVSKWDFCVSERQRLSTPCLFSFFLLQVNTKQSKRGSHWFYNEQQELSFSLQHIQCLKSYRNRKNKQTNEQTNKQTKKPKIHYKLCEVSNINLLIVYFRVHLNYVLSFV